MTHTVKETAAKVGLPSRTLRYYDRIGLVSPPRTPSGYRIYGPEDEGKLRFVRQARALGFSLEEIRELLAVAEQGSCTEVLPEVARLVDEKIAGIDAQMVELAAFREHLVSYRAGEGSGCGCSGHSAFCGCLGDASLRQVEPSGQQANAV